MKTLITALFLWIALSSVPSVINATPKAGSFLIDPSKPYVYLKFDRVGDRQPLSQEEASKGLWLRLVNNCRIPIIVAVFNTGGAGSGIGVYDEVVSSAVRGPVVHFGGLAKGQSASTDLSQAPPRGYALPDAFSTTTISPGESLSFSVPLNHVGPSWGLQIRFYLDLAGDSYGSGPYSVVSFDWQDMPEKFRETAGQ